MEMTTEAVEKAKGIIDQDLCGLLWPHHFLITFLSLAVELFFYNLESLNFQSSPCSLVDHLSFLTFCVRGC